MSKKMHSIPHDLVKMSSEIIAESLTTAENDYLQRVYFRKMLKLFRSH